MAIDPAALINQCLAGVPHVRVSAVGLDIASRREPKASGVEGHRPILFPVNAVPRVINVGQSRYETGHINISWTSID